MQHNATAVSLHPVTSCQLIIPTVAELPMQYPSRPPPQNSSNCFTHPKEPHTTPSLLSVDRVQKLPLNNFLAPSRRYHLALTAARAQLLLKDRFAASPGDACKPTTDFALAVRYRVCFTEQLRGHVLSGCEHSHNASCNQASTSHQLCKAARNTQQQPGQSSTEPIAAGRV